MKGVDVAARFAPALDLGGDLYDFIVPESNSLVIAVGDVSGKGVPAALYSALAGELVRSRTFRRRYAPDGISPAGVLASMNTILHERQLEEYYCTLCYAFFDFKRRTVTMANSGLHYPIRSRQAARSAGEGAVADPPPAAIEVAGVPLGAFPGSSYDELTLELTAGDLFVLCTDGIFEARDRRGRDFGSARLQQVVAKTRGQSAGGVVDEIFDAVRRFRGEARVNDDMTAVAVKITG